jgi:hypothetical protein
VTQIFGNDAVRVEERILRPMKRHAVFAGLTLSFASSHSKLGASAIVWHDYHGFVWCTRDDPLMRFTRRTIGDTGILVP